MTAREMMTPAQMMSTLHGEAPFGGVRHACSRIATIEGIHVSSGNESEPGWYHHHRICSIYFAGHDEEKAAYVRVDFAI